MASESEEYEYAYSDEDEDGDDDNDPGDEDGDDEDDASMDWSTAPADNPNAAPMNFGGGECVFRTTCPFT